jgi:hypothetical protein
LAQRLGKLEYFGAPLGVLAQFVFGHSVFLHGFARVVNDVLADT